MTSLRAVAFASVAYVAFSPVGRGQDQTPQPSVIRHDVQKLLTPGPEIEGHKLFAQRCAVCHIGACTEVPYGGWIDAARLGTIGESRARERILNGSAAMPGFKYTL